MSKTPAFQLQQVTRGQVGELVAFYNDVITFNNDMPDREVRWPVFTTQSMRELIDEGVVFAVRPTAQNTDFPTLCMAVLLDDRPDRDVWPPAEHLLPPKSLRLGRMATAPQLAHQKFNVHFGWPLILEYAKQHGYDAIRCEAYPFPTLHKYYSKTLGMKYCGLRTYRDRHHTHEVTANRYLLMLK